MAFLTHPAYTGAQSWGQVLSGCVPVVDGQGLLAPPWADAIRAAVLFEQQNPAWPQLPQYSDGPAGQVIGFLEQQGFSAFVRHASATEEFAKASMIQGGMMPGGPGLMPVVPVMPVAQMHMGHGPLPPHVACLAQHQMMEVKEKVNIIEAVTAIIGQEIEMANKYRILSEGGAEELFFAVEQTDFCTRQLKQCFPDCAPWSVDLLYTQGGANYVAYHMHRDWTCTFCCFNRPVVEVTDATTGRKVGSIQDPFACCDLTFSMRDENDADALKARGGCCQMGLCCPLPCGPCAEVNFGIEDASSGKDVGSLQKQVPGCCKFFLAPDVDNYKINFGGVTHPEWKAMLLALAIFIDFRYFNDNKNDKDGGLIGRMQEQG